LRKCNAGSTGTVGQRMKPMKSASVIPGFARAGLERLIMPVGRMELTGVILYRVPSTSVPGAILLTGLAGGATVTTLRIGHATYSMRFLAG
jgi:hypothetical protein